METKIDDYGKRLGDLESVNEEKKNWFIKQSLGLLKLIIGVTVLTFLTEMAKEGCRICKIIIGYFAGGSQ